VGTVIEMGWGGITNRKLLALAQQEFDVFVTLDQNFEDQLNMLKARLGLLVVKVPDNKIKCYEPIFAEMRDAAEKPGAGRVFGVTSPLLEIRLNATEYRIIDSIVLYPFRARARDEGLLL